MNACLTCGKEFKLNTKEQKYCSKVCYSQSQLRRILIPCQYCGNDFEIISHEINKRKFCSVDCKNLSMRLELNRVCLYCGNSFEITYANSDRKYCSFDCSNKSKDMRIITSCLNCGKVMLQSKKEFDKGEVCYCSTDCYYESKRNKVIVECKQCGNSFKTVQSEIDRGGALYCSKDCYLLSESNTLHGKHTKGGKRKDLNNTYFRSSWEANYGRYLNIQFELGNILDWSFEKEIFHLGDMKYIPDFKVYENDGTISYREVKGFMTQNAQEKINRFKSSYPEFGFVLIDEKEYSKLHKEYSAIIPNWEKEGHYHV